jgi:hypothetical protein
VTDIEIVVQYGLPKGWNISIVLQRFGGAARHTGLKAWAIFFIESRFIGPEGSAHGTGRSKDTEESDIAEDDVSRILDVVRQMLKFVQNCRMSCMNFVIVTAVYGLSYYLTTSKNLKGIIITTHAVQIVNPILVSLWTKTPPDFPHDARMVLQLVKDRWPTSVLEPDFRVLISKGELMTICDRAWLMSGTGKMEEHLPDWEWGPEVLDCLLKALHRARGAAQEAVKEVDGEMSFIKQSLPDWPWQFVDTNELSDSLLACSKGTQNNKADTQSQDIVLPERPKVRKNKKATSRGRMGLK